MDTLHIFKGCIVYELLIGHPPFSTSSLFQLIKKIRLAISLGDNPAGSSTGRFWIAQKWVNIPKILVWIAQKWSTYLKFSFVLPRNGSTYLKILFGSIAQKWVYKPKSLVWIAQKWVNEPNILIWIA